MARPRCNFQDRERAALFLVYEMVRELNQKVDYIIDAQRDLYYSTRSDRWDYED